MSSTLDVFHARHAGSPVAFTAQQKAIIVPTQPRPLLIIDHDVKLKPAQLKDKPTITSGFGIENLLKTNKAHTLTSEKILHYFDAQHIALKTQNNERGCATALYNHIQKKRIEVFYWPYSLPIKLRPNPRLGWGAINNQPAKQPVTLADIEAKAQIMARLRKAQNLNTISMPKPLTSETGKRGPDVGSIEPIEGNPYIGLFKHLVNETTGGIVYGDTSSINSLKLTPQDAADIRAYKEASPSGYAAAALIAPGSKLKKVGNTFIKKSTANDKITPSNLSDYLKPPNRITGARELKDWDFDGAEEVYAVIRKQNDIEDIAKNTGFKKFHVTKIKNHLFNNKHQLDDGLRRFDADPNIANSWKRLQNGNHTDADIKILKHELFESKFEGIFKTDYRTAHTAANNAGYHSGLE